MKKKYSITLMAAVFILCSCASRENRFIFQPEPQGEPERLIESWEIIESQSGRLGASLPDWVSLYLNGLNREIETMPAFIDKYIFIAVNKGNNIIALRQWASAFAVEQDLPRLVTARIERRMSASTDLYPDDEYGDFFEAFIKSAIDAEYPESKIEERFWFRRRIQIKTDDDAESPPPEDRYEFLVLLSSDRTAMQGRIRALMDGIKTTVPPTRNQAAAINRIKQTFFERF